MRAPISLSWLAGSLPLLWTQNTCAVLNFPLTSSPLGEHLKRTYCQIPQLTQIILALLTNRKFVSQLENCSLSSLILFFSLFLEIHQFQNIFSGKWQKIMSVTIISDSIAHIYSIGCLHDKMAYQMAKQLQQRHVLYFLADEVTKMLRKKKKLSTSSSVVDNFETFALFCKECSHCWTQDMYVNEFLVQSFHSCQ